MPWLYSRFDSGTQSGFPAQSTGSSIAERGKVPVALLPQLVKELLKGAGEPLRRARVQPLQRVEGHFEVAVHKQEKG